MKEREQLVIFEKLKKGEINQLDASKALKISVRWVRKKFKRYKKEGAQGLVHRSRGRSSSKAWAEDQKVFAMSLFEDKFENFGPTFAAEKLKDLYDIKISKETLRKAMIANGYWIKKARRPKHRKRRERKEAFGTMVQLDGSPHDWFEGNSPKCTLLVFIDDATSRIPHMELVPSESTESAMLAFRQYVERNGRPLSLYVDFGGVFSVNVNNPDRDKITQFERVCKELDIEVIHAHSPQAKGRVERSNGTHQDRLIKELRLAEITNMKEANKFIKNVYLPKHNRKFAIDPTKERNVHRSIEHYDLDKIFCLKEERTVQNDFVVQYKKRILQLTKQQRAVVRPKERVTIYERFDNSLAISIRNIPLNFIELQTKPKKSPPEPKKVNNVQSRPRPDHPWRTCTEHVAKSPVRNGGY